MNKQMKYSFGKLSKRQTNRKGLILGSMLALFVFITGAYSCKNNNTANQQSQQKADSLTTAHDSLQAQYNAAKIQVDDLTTKSYALDSQVRQKDDEIAKLEKQMAGLKKKNRNLVSALKKDKTLISSLRNELDDKSKNYSEQLSLLQNERDNLAHERDSLLTKYHSLKELGSVLHASNIRVEGLHEKHNGKKEKKTVKARKLNVLRIYFDIDENRIAEDGTKQLYLVILGPDGSLLTNLNNRGSFTNSKGATINYSIMKEVALKQNEPVKDVTVDWEQEGEHRKGIYTITIYNGGYKIGSGSVTLK